MSTPLCKKQRSTKVRELVCTDIAEDAKARENGIAFVEYSDILHSQDQYRAAKNHGKGAYDVMYYRSGLSMGHQYHCRYMM
jgi:hypothetical protein